MAEHFRIDELKRRLEQDPASIAFAQLAEALRRSGRIDEAIETCRSGLAHHPSYLSAHVTLGRALIEHGDLDAAQAELGGVLAEAPENLAAIRGLADIHQRRGQQSEALEHYRRALSLAPNDSELEETVSRLASGLDASPVPPPVATAQPTEPAADGTPAEALAAESPAELQAEPPAEQPPAEPTAGQPPAELSAYRSEAELSAERALVGPLAPDVPAAPATDVPAEPPTDTPAATQADLSAATEAEAGTEPAARQVEALERWLDAILADRLKA